MRWVAGGAEQRGAMRTFVFKHRDIACCQHRTRSQLEMEIVRHEAGGVGAAAWDVLT
jgi:hypothetical protein